MILFVISMCRSVKRTAGQDTACREQIVKEVLERHLLTNEPVGTLVDNIFFTVIIDLVRELQARNYHVWSRTPREKDVNQSAC